MKFDFCLTCVQCQDDYRSTKLQTQEFVGLKQKCLDTFLILRKGYEMWFQDELIHVQQ
jgi:hypothetical protein